MTPTAFKSHLRRLLTIELVSMRHALRTSPDLLRAVRDELEKRAVRDSQKSRYATAFFGQEVR